jgi:uncharacterized membrane protein
MGTKHSLTNFYGTISLKAKWRRLPRMEKADSSVRNLAVHYLFSIHHTFYDLRSQESAIFMSSLLGLNLPLKSLSAALGETTDKELDE